MVKQKVIQMVRQADGLLARSMRQARLDEFEQGHAQVRGLLEPLLFLFVIVLKSIGLRVW